MNRSKLPPRLTVARFLLGLGLALVVVGIPLLPGMGIYVVGAGVALLVVSVLLTPGR